MVARRAQQNAPGQGGWQIYHTSPYGVDLATPTSAWVRADGNNGVNGWATNAAVEVELVLVDDGPGQEAGIDHLQDVFVFQILVELGQGDDRLAGRFEGCAQRLEVLGLRHVEVLASQPVPKPLTPH